MSLPTPKELKRLAAACRKAGITHFKQGDLEITVSEDAPQQHLKRGKHAASTSVQGEVESQSDWESLTDEEKLFWSVGGTAEEMTERSGT